MLSQLVGYTFTAHGLGRDFCVDTKGAISRAKSQHKKCNKDIKGINTLLRSESRSGVIASGPG